MPSSDPGSRSAAAAPTNTPGRPSRAARTNGTRSMLAKPSSSAGGSSSRSARICCVGVSTPGSCRAAAFSSGGASSRPKRSSSRSTRLTCACASGVSSQTQRTARPWRAAAATTSLRERAREVRVVEDDLARARGEGLVERVGELAERAAALVAIEPQVAALDVLPARRRDFPAPGMPIDQHDVARRLRRLALRGRARPRSACSSSSSSQRRRAGGRARGLRAGVRQGRDDVRPEAEHPRERDLGLGGAMRLARSRASAWIAGEPRRATRSAERRVGNEREPGIGTAVDEACLAARRRRTRLSATWTAAIGACSRASSSCGRFTLQTPTRGDEALVDEPGERTHGRRPLDPRVGSVEQVEVDGAAVERGEARLAVGADRASPAVRASSLPSVRAIPPFVTTRALGDAPGAPGRRAPRCPRTPGRVSKTVIPPRSPRRSSRARAPRRQAGACSRVRRAARRGRASSSRRGRARGRRPRAARPRPRARVARRGPQRREGLEPHAAVLERPVPATNPSTRNVALTSPPSITAARCSSGARGADRRGSVRGCRSAGGGGRGAGVSAGGSGARGRS